MRRVIALLIGAAAVAPLAGCSSGNAVVTGRASEDGGPVRLRDRERANVLFVRDVPSGLSVAATVKPDGTFATFAPDGKKGLPPGKYRVGFTRGSDDAPRAALDLDPKDSPIELDLAPGERVELAVDFGKKTVTRSP